MMVIVFLVLVVNIMVLWLLGWFCYGEVYFWVIWLFIWVDVIVNLVVIVLGLFVLILYSVIFDLLIGVGIVLFIFKEVVGIL